MLIGLWAMSHRGAVRLFICFYFHPYRGIVHGEGCYVLGGGWGGLVTSLSDSQP